MNDSKLGPVPSLPEDEPAFVLRGKDLAAPAAIQRYADECVRQGSPPEHVAAVRRRGHEIARWQEEHPDRCKVAD